MICHSESVEVPVDEFDRLRRDAELWRANKCRMIRSGRVRTIRDGVTLGHSEYNAILRVMGMVGQAVSAGWILGPPRHEFEALRDAYADYHAVVYNMQIEYMGRGEEIINGAVQES